MGQMKNMYNIMQGLEWMTHKLIEEIKNEDLLDQFKLQSMKTIIEMFERELVVMTKKFHGITKLSENDRPLLSKKLGIYKEPSNKRPTVTRNN